MILLPVLFADSSLGGSKYDGQSRQEAKIGRLVLIFWDYTFFFNCFQKFRGKQRENLDFCQSKMLEIHNIKSDSAFCRDNHTVSIGRMPFFVDSTLKEIISQIDLYLVSLSSKTYVFEDKMTKY